MSSDDPLLELRQVEYSYGESRALRGVDFVVEPGEIVAYLGPNGAGKSTTMHLITGRLRPDAGSVRVLGLDPARDGTEARRRMGYVPEVAPLHESLSGLEQLTLVALLRGNGPEAAEDKAKQMLDVLDLAEVADRPLWSYSRGMKQRVALATAFLDEPELVLLDEPLYGLDVQTVLLVKEVVRSLAASGRGVVYCSHLLDVAETLATRVVILRAGEVVADGSPDLLRAGHGDASLEECFRELTLDRDAEQRARRLLDVGRAGRGPEDAR